MICGLDKAGGALIVGVFLGGCATDVITTTPINIRDTKDVPDHRILVPSYLEWTPESAFLVITRDKKTRNVSCSTTITIDDESVLDMYGGEGVTLYLMPKEYEIGAKPRMGCSGPGATVRVKVSKEYTAALRIGFSDTRDLLIVPGRPPRSLRLD